MLLELLLYLFCALETLSLADGLALSTLLILVGLEVLTEEGLEALMEEGLEALVEGLALLTLLCRVLLTVVGLFVPEDRRSLVRAILPNELG